MQTWNINCRIRNGTLAGLAFMVMPAFGQVPPHHYDLVDSTSPATLRQTLHDVIDDHTRFPYTASSTDTWDILEAADQDSSNANNILDLYRNTSITKQGGGNTFYNREHSWPKSYGFPNNNGSNYPYTDSHALFLANSGYNSSRSNKPYRSCGSACEEKPTEENNGNGGGTGVFPGNSNWTTGSLTSGTWETWSGRRGDVARALFYMDVRYEGGTHGGTGASEPDLILTNDETLIASSNTGNNEDEAYMGMLTVLLAWHAQDPVDDLERQRNDAVHSRQGNRNPFIDHPEWVACVFSNTCAVSSMISVWINEIHYDNEGADQGEFAEVAGPPGTDLSGWLLIGYNGATGSVYRTVQLSGTIPNQGGAVGALAFDFPGLQNGERDAIALVNESGAVVEFLSYEGSLTAGNGPAQGISASDIGVEESNSTPAGHSLQRVGSGEDSSWRAAAPNTRGGPNP